MTAREECLRHYGGCCAWCGNTTGLELDHIDGGQGQGNAHRQAIKGKLQYWLKRQGFPAGFEVLCRSCHQQKSADEREELMPSRNGAREIRGNIDEALAAQIDAIASKPGTSKSEVLEQALTAYVSGNGQQAGMAGVLKRLHEQTTALEALERTVKAIGVQIATMDERQKTMAHQQIDILGTMRALWDDHQATQKTLRQRWWWKLFCG